MWLNSRDLARDDDGITTDNGVWGFAGSSQNTTHGSIGASGSRTLWNRMEPAEEEREEEALPSYLSYLQPPFRPASTTSTPLTPHALPSMDFYTPKRQALDQSVQVPQRLVGAHDVDKVAQKSSELAQALEHLVLGSFHRHVRDTTTDGFPSKSCGCSCDSVKAQMQEIARRVQTLQNQVLELAKGSAMELERSTNGSTWSATAPPFVPKQQQSKQPSPLFAPCVDQSTATVLSDRISTLEGRQSAFQSQLAQIAKVLGIPTGKPGKHSPVKHLVQTLRDEVDVKVQEACTSLTTEIRTALGEYKDGDRGNEAHLSSHAVLAALAGEHEASLTRLSKSFEELLSEEARQRAALEARIRSQLTQQEEWLQQLEGAFGSPYDPEHDRHARSSDLCSVNRKLEALERSCHENHTMCQRLSRLLSTKARLSLNNGEADDDEEEDGLSWPGHMIDRG